MSGPRSAAAVLVSAVLLAAATFEAAIALGWIAIGGAPGVGAAHEGTARLVGLAAALAGVVLLCAVPVRVAAAIPLAACALMLARYYSFDPYYAPDLRRMSDGGLFAPIWVYPVMAATLVCAAGMVLRPRAFSTPAAVTVVLCAATVVAAGAGH